MRPWRDALTEYLLTYFDGVTPVDRSSSAPSP
jgi:hypothetical protein